MKQLNKNRLIGGAILALVVFLFAPSILSPKPSTLNNPTFAVRMQSNKPENSEGVAQQRTKTLAVAATPQSDIAPTLPLDASAPSTQTQAQPQAIKLASTSTLPPPPDTRTADNHSKSRWLRVGSFSAQSNADNLVHKLSGNFPVHQEDIQVNDTTYHRVLIGPYHSEQDLKAAKEALSTSGIQTSIQN